MIVGVQGVQGAGKSTLCRTMCERNRGWGAISLDDFYLPDAELRALYAESRDPLWAGRGNPGTHDVAALLGTLRRFKAGESSTVPVYDKTRFGGRGDRVGSRTLPPGDVLLVEGWCLGFQPDDGRDNVNVALRAYDALYDLMDAMLVLRPTTLGVVYTWRRQSERCMTDAETTAFIDRYMPAYDRYLPGLYRTPPVRPCLVVTTDGSRRPLNATVVS